MAEETGPHFRPTTGGRFLGCGDAVAADGVSPFAHVVFPLGSCGSQVPLGPADGCRRACCFTACVLSGCATVRVPLLNPKLETSARGREEQPLKSINTILAIGALAAISAAAEAGVIAAWDFQTTTNGGTAAVAAPGSPKVYVANFGSGTLYLDGSNFSSDFFLPSSGTTSTEISAFGGTSVNADTVLGMSTVTSGAASLAILGGATSGGVSAANGKSMVFKFSMAGMQGLEISYATQRTATGFTSQLFEYSTDRITTCTTRVPRRDDVPR